MSQPPVPRDDPYDLQRFVAAQEPVFETVLRELRAGRKRSHWIWYVFPQLRDLGRSERALFFGIASLDEARAYLAHPVLGPRLAQAVDAVCGSGGRTLNQVFGSPDDMKFRSCMTLFDRAAPDGPYHAALDRWPDGELDERTLALLARP